MNLVAFDDFSKWVLLGYACGRTKIYKINQSVGDGVIYGLFDGDELVCSVYGRMVGKYFEIGDTYTYPGFQRKGYATSLYVNLITKYSIPLMSGSSQTELGWRLWQTLRTRNLVKILDTVSSTIIIDDGSIPDSAIYTVSDLTGDRFRFVSEQLAIKDLWYQSAITADFSRFVAEDHRVNGID